MQEITEIWTDIKGYEGLYQISNKGNIKSFISSKILSPLFANGYLQVRLYKNSKSIRQKIHRLVAAAFIPNPANKPQVNHKNGIKTDNRVENLEWVTASENTRHAHKNGLCPITDKHRQASRQNAIENAKKRRKLTSNQIEDIKYFRNVLGWGSPKLSKFMGIKKHLIDNVIYYTKD